MVCIFCGQNTQVINSRRQKRLNSTWRRRRCIACKNVFTTEEFADYSGSWQVRHGVGQLSAFDRDKLLLSLHRSCLHRKQALRDAQSLTNTIISSLNPDQGMVEASSISSLCKKTLKRFDKAAFSHYDAFHQSLAK